MSEPRTLSVVFFKTRQGREPVRDWLRELDQDDRRAIGYDLMRVQVGWPVGMPLCRSLGGGLWEVRSSLAGGRIARLVFVAHEQRIIVLHGFLKTTQSTPKTDLELARARAKEIIS